VDVTGNLPDRINLHRSGEVAGFTRKYGWKRLVHVEFFGYLHEALLREKRLKRWRRAWKIELIEQDNPYWNDLSDQIERAFRTGAV
jgi:putative endonuclease